MESTSNSVQTPAENSFVSKFVAYIFDRCAKDRGTAARLRRADNPATEYQSWDVLATFGIDIEKEYVRLPFATIAAAIAKSRAEHDGPVSLGEAIASCFEGERESTAAQARLRRLLACSAVPEVCRMLRGTLALIESKSASKLCYSRLLSQLKSFHFDDQRIKSQWAAEFYKTRPGKDETVGGDEC